MHQSKYAHAEQVKRKSMGELAAPEGSTQAHFPHSNTNLAGTRATPVQSPNNQPARRQEPERPSFGKKMMNILCCGGGSS
jgi:casein kinase 1